jgi:hypothetical protein
MGKEDFGYQTTIRAARGDSGHSHFARAFNVRDKLLAATLPALWIILAVVVVVVVARLWR